MRQLRSYAYPNIYPNNLDCSLTLKSQKVNAQEILFCVTSFLRNLIQHEIDAILNQNKHFGLYSKYFQRYECFPLCLTECKRISLYSVGE